MFPTRRDLLRATSALPFASLVSARATEPEFQGMIVRQNEPQNLEMPFASLSEWKVPTERFYVRSHFPTPKLDAKAFKLVVEGHVEIVIITDDVRDETGGTAMFRLRLEILQGHHGCIGPARGTEYRRQ